MEPIAFAVLFFIAVFEIPTSESSYEKMAVGKKTTIENYPYQLSLQKDGDHYCGASLIRPNIALTAAHCFSSFPGMYKIRANATNYKCGGILVGILEYCKHLRHQDDDYDVTVLLLDQSLPLGPGIQTIPLQEAGVEVKDGTYGTVTGWGDASSPGGSLSEILHVVQIHQINCKVCKKKIKTITPRMVCYGYEKTREDGCQGDSGGPLVVDGKQVGIAIWGVGCPFPGKPEVYTKISNKEIHKHIETCIAEFSRTDS